MKRLAIFGSGSGTNAENIIKYFRDSDKIRIALVLSDKADAYILERGRKAGIASLAFSKKDFNETDHVLRLLIEHQIDFIVLAGFLKLVPANILNEYNGRIINIHPAL